MDNVYEIEFTKEELEIINQALIPDVRLDHELTLYAKGHDKKPDEFLYVHRTLKKRIANIINTK